MTGVTLTRALREEVLTIVFGFGQGARLFPLTAERAKAALPFLGKYRLIDLVLSRCLMAGLRRIYVLTQFHSASLNRHIMQTYRLGRFSEPAEFIEVLAAEQTPESQDWYRGPTHALRRAWRHFESQPARQYLLLPGDYVGDVPLDRVVAFHHEMGADVTLVVVSADEEMARARGVVKIAGSRAHPSTWRVLDYQEEPRGEALRRLRGEEAPEGKPYLVATGISLFRHEVLARLLEEVAGPFDLGLELLPLAIAKYRVWAYWHGGYWDDVSTLSAYYAAQMRMLGSQPPLRLADPTAFLYTRPRYLPPAKIRDAQIADSLIAEGSIVEGAEIHRSILGLRTRVGRGVSLEGVIVFGAEFFPSSEEVARDRERGLPPIGIGEGAHIRRAILDRNVRIGANVRILNASGLEHADGPNYYIREGIVIIPKNAVIPEGSVI